MPTFNELLAANDIDPREVSLLRHQTRAENGRTPYDLWRTDRPAFELYQRTQQPRPVFRKPKYWASFVAPSKLETMFVGLYEANLVPDGQIDWLDPLTGNAVGGKKPGKYDLFNTNLSTSLADQIGRLCVDWRDSVRSWAQHASRTTKVIVEPRNYVSPPTSREIDLASKLGTLGFVERHRTEKLTMYTRGPLTIYLKRKTDRLPIVLHPWFEAALDQLLEIQGVTFESPTRYYINSNLSTFPVYRSSDRASASRYGLACDTATDESLAALTTVLDRYQSIDTPDGPVVIGGVERETDRLELRLARIGQGTFRCGLNRYWDGRCAVTGIAAPALLRASHILAWKKADNRQRLDPFNGLLLAAHLDALFDRHLIGFAADGRLISSSRLDQSIWSVLGLDITTARLSRIDLAHRPYLRAHRDQMTI